MLRSVSSIDTEVHSFDPFHILDIGIIPNVKFIKNLYKFIFLKWHLYNKPNNPTTKVKFVMFPRAYRETDLDGVQPNISPLLSLFGT